MEELADPVTQVREGLARDGCTLLPGRLDPDELARLSSLTEDILGERAGMRSLLELEWGVEFVRSAEVQAVLSEIGYIGGFCVRGILFDKHSGANWKVPWHQDRKIAVKERLEVEGFRSWSVKERMTHCQPTAEILADMMALRFHIDDCGESNGPLKVLPGTHNEGFLTINASMKYAESIPVEFCTCIAGDVIVMKPLLLHASSEATTVGHRRVLHLEFAKSGLPGGLEWLFRV